MLAALELLWALGEALFALIEGMCLLAHAAEFLVGCGRSLRRAAGRLRG